MALNFFLFRVDVFGQAIWTGTRVSKVELECRANVGACQGPCAAVHRLRASAHAASNNRWHTALRPPCRVLSAWCSSRTRNFQAVDANLDIVASGTRFQAFFWAWLFFSQVLFFCVFFVWCTKKSVHEFLVQNPIFFAQALIRIKHMVTNFFLRIALSRNL